MASRQPVEAATAGLAKKITVGGRERADLSFWACFGRFWAAGPVAKGLGAAVGFIWKDSRGLATILNPFRTIFVYLGPDSLSETSTSVLSQQQTSVLSQQHTSVLSQQQTSVLSQQKTSILSQQKTRQLPASGRLLIC